MRLALLIVLLFLSTAARADPVTAAVAVFAAWATTTAGIIIITATVLSAGVAIYGSAQARRAERDSRNAMNAAMQDRMATRIATESPHRYVYGRAKVGSDIVAMFTSGDKDQYKHIVCVLAAHECDAVEEVYVNNVAIGLSSVTAAGDVTGGRYVRNPETNVIDESHNGPTFTLSTMPLAGSVSAYVGFGAQAFEVEVTNVTGRTVTVAHTGPVLVSYEIAVARRFGESVDPTVATTHTPYVRVQVHLGTPTDPADAYLMSVMPAKWPSTAVLRGLCYLVVTLDLNNPEFQGGQVPIQALVRGRKLYDPRTGLTAWSANPALAIRDYLTSVLCGVPATDLPDSQFITAANVCDDASVVPGGRYTCNGTVTSDQDQSHVLEAMAQSMAGGIVSTSWDIYAGNYVAPVAALLQSDIVGSISITPGVSDAAIYNGVKGQYLSDENDHVLTDFQPYQNATYRAADGRDLYTDISFPFTNSLQRVTNLARIFTEDQRNGFTIKAEFSLKAWPLKVGQRVTYTSAFIGQTAKVYRITDKSYAPNSAVELTLKEDAASIWDFADAVTLDSTPNTDLPDPWAIAPLSSLSCTSGLATLQRQADGSIVPRILVTWPVASTQAVFTNGEIELEWRALGTDTWQKAQASGDDTQAYLSPITPGFFYVVRGRTVNPYLNTKSDWVVTRYQVEVFTATLKIYKWSTAQPAAPAGVGAFVWSTGSFAAPAGWSLAQPVAPGGTAALFIAEILISDIDITGSTAFDWASAVVSSSANAAYAAAAAAQTVADAANTALAAIFADDTLSRNEKPDVLAKWTSISDERLGLINQAATFGVSSTAYQASYDTLSAGLPAGYNTLTTDTTLAAGGGALLRSKFADYYLKKQTLINSIAAETARRSDWNYGMANKPADSALLNSAILLGGRNFILDSQHIVDNPNNTGLGTSTLMTDEAIPYYRINASAGSISTYCLGGTYPKIPAGTVCTISTEVRRASAGDAGMTVNGPGASTTVPANVWTRISYTFTYLGGILYTGHTCSIGQLDYRNYKLEMGNKASDWTPAPEDVAAATAAAQSSADAANTALANIASDNILSPSEKPSVVLDYTNIIAEQGGIDAQATAYGITTAKTDYDNAISFLTSYLNGLTGWNTLPGGDVAVVGTTFRANFAAVYAKRQTLLNAIATAAGNAPGAVIGGRNLLLDSGFERGTHPCTSRSGVAYFDLTGQTVGRYSGTNALFFDGTASDMYVYIGGPLTVVVPGVTYMLSFYYKSAGAITGSSTHWRLSDGSHLFMPLTSLGVQTVWTRHVMQWTCPAGVTTIEPRFGIATSGAYAWMAVDAIQIEQGNKETQWNPAPEDLTLAAQGFTGDLNASADITLYADSTITLSGNTAVKNGSAGWNAQVISASGYGKGAFAEAKVWQGELMFGLNTDKNTNNSYETLDHALYFRNDGLVEAYRNGYAVSAGSWLPGDTFYIAYLGNRVVYQRNGVEISFVAEGEGYTFFFDSSFYSNGAKLTNIRFGPMTAGTVGAPAGTQVNGVPVETLTSQASAGASASTTLSSPPAVNGMGDVYASVFKPKVLISTQVASLSSGTIKSVVWNFAYGDRSTPLITYALDSTTGGSIMDRMKVYAIALTSDGTVSTAHVDCIVTAMTGQVTTTSFNITVDC